MFPESLKIGDKVAIISPSGRIEASLVDKTKLLLESWGLTVVPGISVFNKYGRFAGTDEERLHDLQWALDDNEIRAVICSRGGYGLIHLTEQLSLKCFTKNPKWIIGYSDITILHAMLRQTGIASIHAPMCAHFSLEGEDKATLLLKDLIFGEIPSYKLPGHQLNRVGDCKGILHGGNLSILSTLRCTPYDLLPENTILFLEDIGERHYHIERMMYNLRLSGVLERLSGLIIGRFMDCEDDQMMNKSIYESIAGLVSDYKYPVCFDFPTGHIKENFPMICGASVELKVNTNSVSCNFTNN